MEKNLKLISARIDPRTLNKIDQFIAAHPYWKRNAVINNILTSVLMNADYDAIYDLVRWCPPSESGLQISVEKKHKLL